MKRYDRYFLGIFAQSLVLVLALTTTIFLVVDLLLNLDKIQAFPDVAKGSALFYAYNLPPILYQLYPLMVIAAGTFAVARVLRARELLLLEAAGVSRRRALAAIIIPALLLGFVGLGLRQFALPDLAQAARESPYGAFEFRKGKRISVRDQQGNVWFVRAYNLDNRSLEGVRILSADGKRLVTTDELRWIDEQEHWWSARPGTVQDLDALTATDARPVESAFEGVPPIGELYPAEFARRRRSYSDRPLTELITEAFASPDNRDLHTNLWHELWHPFSGFILLSCGLGLLLWRGARSPFAAGSMAIAAVVGYQILLFWFETMAQAGAFAPAIGASIVPVMFAVFGAVVFARTS